MMIQELYSNERAQRSYSFHSKHKEENNLDPDDGNSSLCSACNLPIFSTPLVATESGSGYLHDQCSNLPIDLVGSDLYNSLEPLRKRPNLYFSICSMCNVFCGGDVLYRCRDEECNFQLDVTCAWPVKILHRSHDHRLTVIRCSKGFSCSACGTEHRLGQHRQGLLRFQPMLLAYVCSACDFWLHPHCATLPNAIQHKRHHHPLLLNYDDMRWRKCAICGDQLSIWGFYSCTVCFYEVHIMCAVTDKQIFKPVLLREAFQENRVPELVHFPVPDEYTSITRHIAKCTFFTSDDVVHHQHPLTLHHNYPVHIDDDEINDDDDIHSWLPKCNGCGQFISPPFCTCSQCPKLFLHDSCARLPSMLSRTYCINNRASSIVVSKTSCCRRLTNGFTICGPLNPNMDIMCGLMPRSITHAAHAKTHVLRSLYIVDISSKTMKCHCCNRLLSGQSYKCLTCRNFNIHATCARLPATVCHVYDRHPLELITAPPPHVQSHICDACEEGLDSTQWYYGCTDCEQAFHVDCVPCLDQLSLINYEIAEVRVAYHKCPLTLVRGHTVRGRKCGRCGEGYREHRNSMAFECSKCYFSIHVTCFETLSKLFDKSAMMTLSLQDL